MFSPQATHAPPAQVQVTAEGETLRLQFPYSPRIIEQVKSIPGRQHEFAEQRRMEAFF